MKTPWHYKPWWCQPWSILLTGVLIITGSWLTFKIVWLTILISLAIFVWWFYFLVLWPKLMIESGILTTPENIPKSSLTELKQHSSSEKSTSVTSEDDSSVQKE